MRPSPEEARKSWSAPPKPIPSHEAPSGPGSGIDPTLRPC